MISQSYSMKEANIIMDLLNKDERLTKYDWTELMVSFYESSTECGYKLEVTNIKRYSDKTCIIVFAQSFGSGDTVVYFTSPYLYKSPQFYTNRKIFKHADYTGIVDYIVSKVEIVFAT